MAERHSQARDPGACVPSGKDADTAPSPRQNLLLAALPKAEYERLLPALEFVPLPEGFTVHGAGAQQRYLHFLTSGLVARMYVTAEGASAAYAVTGREGVIGIASFLGGKTTPSQSVVLIAGGSYRIGAHRLQHEFEHDGPLPRLLLRYTQALIAHTGMVAICNRHHSLDQRLCRWLLSCMDRLPTDELTMTQDAIGIMLGVRRMGVTEALGRLQDAGLIHCGRGRMVVLDRQRMEASACECYRVIKREYGRLPLLWHVHRMAGPRRGHRLHVESTPLPQRA